MFLTAFACNKSILISVSCTLIYKLTELLQILEFLMSSVILKLAKLMKEN